MHFVDLGHFHGKQTKYENYFKVIESFQKYQKDLEKSISTEVEDGKLIQREKA